MAVGALIPIPALAAQEIPARLGAVVPGLRSKVVLEPAVIAIPAAIIRLEILTDGYRLLNGATIHLLVLPSTRARHSHVVKTTPLIHLITRVATTGSGGHYFFMRALYKPIHSNFILGIKLFCAYIVEQMAGMRRRGTMKRRNGRPCRGMALIIVRRANNGTRKNNKNSKKNKKNTRKGGRK